MHYSLKEIVQEHNDLICKAIHTFKPNNQFELEEYKHVAMIGVQKALDTYEEDNNTKLTTWIFYNVRWELLKHNRKDAKQRQNLQYVPTYFAEINGTSMSHAKESYYEDTHQNALDFYLPDNLSDREEKAIRMYSKGYNFREIGEELDVSRSWAHRIYKAGIKKIKKANV